MWSLRWTVFVIGAIAYGGAALGWGPRPTEQEAVLGLVLFIFLTLTEIGEILERMAPPKEGRKELP
jgi:hypothetical protein